MKASEIVYGGLWAASTVKVLGYTWNAFTGEYEAFGNIDSGALTDVAGLGLAAEAVKHAGVIKSIVKGIAKVAKKVLTNPVADAAGGGAAATVGDVAAGAAGGAAVLAAPIVAVSMTGGGSPKNAPKRYAPGNAGQHGQTSMLPNRPSPVPRNNTQ